ncbi:MAG: CRISPR-associated protein Csx15 [Promethearchaeota archaeon]
MPFKKNKIIDFSGHKAVKINIDDMSNPLSFEMEAMRLCNLIEDDNENKKAAQAGKIVVILPGLSVLSSCFLAEFHGRFGYFPKLKWYLRNAKSGEFTISSKEMDLQKVRYTARSIRG